METIPEQPPIVPEETEHYVPRPRWQVWCARIGLVLFLIFVVYQLLAVAGGGR